MAWKVYLEFASGLKGLSNSYDTDHQKLSYNMGYHHKKTAQKY